MHQFSICNYAAHFTKKETYEIKSAPLEAFNEVNMDFQYLDVPVEHDQTALVLESSGQRGLGKFAQFTPQFATWEPNSLHWQAPSNLVVYSDGTWFLFAQHCANFRRLGGSFDTGATYTWFVDAIYYDQPGGVGNIIHAINYGLVSLPYKSERDNVTASGFDARYLALEPKILSARFGRSLR